MATYIPGVTDYIPQIQPFEPDYNFYQQALTFRQSKHDAAREQLSTLYGSLLNSDLTRDDNIQSRDNFFKTIEQDIKKMSGMDLSKSQNTHAATSIFNQMLDNKNIVKDMNWTKRFQNETKRAQGFKNCKNPEDCGGQWWEGGEQLLQHSYQEFREASAEEAMNMSPARFVPYQDVTKMAVDLAKEADLKVQGYSDDGRWLITHQNGKLVEGTLYNLFVGSIGGDPKVQEYYKAQAQLQRKNYVRGYTEQYGSVQAAEDAYINETEAQDVVDVNQREQQKIDAAINDAPPSQRNKLEELRQEYAQIGQSYQQAADYTKSVNGETKVANNNNKYLPGNVDAMVAFASLKLDLAGAAQIMSMHNADTKVEVNPYGLEQVQHQNRMLLEDYKTRNQASLKQLDAELEAKKLKYMIQGEDEHNKPKPVKLPNMLNVGKEDPNDPTVVQRKQIAYEKDRDAVLQGMSSGESVIVNDFYNRSVTAAKGHDITAQKDVVEMTRTAVYASGDYNLIEKFEEDMKGKAISEKFKIATGAKYKVNLDQTSSLTLDKLYRYTSEVTDSKKSIDNKALRPYLNDFWKTHMQTKRTVDARSLILSQVEGNYAKTVNDVVGAVRVKYGKEEADVLRAYIGPNGRPNDINTFVTEMMKRGYDEDDAVDMYAVDPDDYGDDDMVQYKLGKYFTEFGKVEGDQAWLDVPGSGNEYSLGNQYTVDFARTGSVGYYGTKGFINDALNSSTAKFYVGGIGEENPKDNATARAAIQILADDARRNYKLDDKSRPQFTVTYANQAGINNPNQVALNIKIPEYYSKEYKGSDGDGTMANMKELATNGVTIVVDKKEANNIFTQGATLTAPEILLRRTGRIDYDMYPEYLQNFGIVSNKQTGMYEVGGKVRVGLDGDGKDVWEGFALSFPYLEDTSNMIAKVDTFVASVIDGSFKDDELYKLNNR
mgnify:CR=1 FL=1